MSSVIITTIDLLRHGESEGGEIFRGTTDVLLNELGWQQMLRVVGFDDGASFPWDTIFSSPLRRCADFSQHLSATANIQMRIADPLQEIYFGEWEGQLVSDIQKQDNERLQAFWRDPEKNSPPRGEPTVEAYDRANQFLDQICERQSGKHLLLVSHGGIIRLLLIRALGLPMTSLAQISVPYACFSRIQVYQMEGKSPWMQLISHHSSLKHMQSQ